DQHLRPAAAGEEHRDAFLKPAPDRAVDEFALRLAMPRIVETNECASPLRRKAGERGRLGALHVRLEAAEPEQAGWRAGERTHRDGARAGACPDIDELQRLGHRTLRLTRLAPIRPPYCAGPW